ncbi:hypothetical protein FACS1894120_3010 [Clostridia bacterium]|nr:hypothetical protein FACS1894120_3010 [Clostridia bacterium]
MDSKKIIGQRFETAFKGYKAEDVDDFLQEAGRYVHSLEKRNKEVEESIAVLWEKIEGYRADEDVLKQTLLGAQKQGNAIISDAKKRAEDIAEQNALNCKKQKEAAEAECAEIRETAAKHLADTKTEAGNILAAARAKAEDIATESEIETEIQHEVITRTAEEAVDFRKRIIRSIEEFKDGFTRSMQNFEHKIESFPGDSENDFVRKTVIERRRYTAQYNGSSVKDEPVPKPAEIPVFAPVPDSISDNSAAEDSLPNLPDLTDETAEIAKAEEPQAVDAVSADFTGEISAAENSVNFDAAEKKNVADLSGDTSDLKSLFAAGDDDLPEELVEFSQSVSDLTEEFGSGFYEEDGSLGDTVMFETRDIAAIRDSTVTIQGAVRGSGDKNGAGYKPAFDFMDSRD